MADITNLSSQHPNPSLQSLLHCLDPISLILSQNPDSNQPLGLRLTSESFFTMERGPRYKAYADLRESRLRARNSLHYPEPIRASTPPRKQVKFQTNIAEANTKRRGSNACSVAQSVPDFSSVLRKENRKPAMATVFEMTPPGKSSVSKAKSMANSNSKGSKSANSAGEKRGMAAMARKSYASIDELKGFSFAAANAINGGGGVARRTVLGYRPF